MIEWKPSKICKWIPVTWEMGSRKCYVILPFVFGTREFGTSGSQSIADWWLLPQLSLWNFSQMRRAAQFKFITISLGPALMKRYNHFISRRDNSWRAVSTPLLPEYCCNFMVTALLSLHSLTTFTCIWTLKLVMLLLWPPQLWDYRHEPWHPDQVLLLTAIFFVAFSVCPWSSICRRVLYNEGTSPFLFVYNKLSSNTLAKTRVFWLH